MRYGYEYLSDSAVICNSLISRKNPYSKVIGEFLYIFPNFIVFLQALKSAKRPLLVIGAQALQGHDLDNFSVAAAYL